MGSAARQGLWNAGSAYSRTANNLKYAARSGLNRVGTSYNRGWQKLGSGISRIGSAYMDGLSRVGAVASDIPSQLGSVASSSVNRIGEFASEGAQQLGGIATDIVDVATVIPRGVAAVAKEKKVQDCLLQTICYASTPFLGGKQPYHSKHTRRMRRRYVRVRQQ